jgi:hypothetical protein
MKRFEEFHAMDSHSASSQQKHRGADEKRCMVCGGNIVWRRRLAADWDKVMYCSASCRRVAVAKTDTGRKDQVAAYDQFNSDSAASAA